MLSEAYRNSAVHWCDHGVMFGTWSREGEWVIDELWGASPTDVGRVWGMTHPQSRRRLVAPPNERMPMHRGSSKVLVCEINLLTLWPWPLTFELKNSITSTVSQGHSLYQVWTVCDHSFLSYAPKKQTKQTDKQTDWLEHTTHADRHSRRG